MITGKVLVASWTFWFGALQILTAIVGFLGGFTDPMAAYTLVITGLGTIGLRLKTSAPITGIVSK